MRFLGGGGEGILSRGVKEWLEGGVNARLSRGGVSRRLSRRVYYATLDATRGGAGEAKRRACKGRVKGGVKGGVKSWRGSLRDTTCKHAS